jgi:hypothetical protein
MVFPFPPGVGQNGWEPRVGFAWQLPGTSRVVLGGGYGIYYTRTTGQPFFQLLASPPYGKVNFICRELAPEMREIANSHRRLGEHKYKDCGSELAQGSASDPVHRAIL